MTDKEKIKEQANIDISNLRKAQEQGFITEFGKGKLEALEGIVDFIDSLQEEPVSEDFEKALANEWKGYIDRGAATVDALEDNTQELAFAKGFYRGAQWQKEQDQSTIELAEDHAMLAGMEKMKEEMMEKAIEVTVHIDAGNYPYIPQIELYDYDKDIPLAKEGDKYKVILIKED